MVENINYSYRDLSKLIDAVTEKYPFIRRFSIGKSCLNKDITALRIGRAKNCMLFAAGIHGSEHITTNIIMYFLYELASALYTDSRIGSVRVSKALKDCGVIIVPMVNPDGCDIAINGISYAGRFSELVRRTSKGDTAHWNANARGVDINHNFSAGFKEVKALERKSGFFSAGPTRFGGNYPESEPETAALCALCRNINIRHAVALHTQGEVIYWNYGNHNPRSSEQMAQIMATASGYALDIPEGIAYGAGFKDWFIEEFNRPAFTVEAGLGENPLDIKTAHEIYERLKSMLTLCAIM